MTHPLRVLHVVAAGEIGGAERMLIDLVRDDDAHAVALFTPNDQLRRLFVEGNVSIEDRGRDVREGPLSYLSSTLGSSDVRWLTDVLVRRNASIVHLHTFASQVLGTRAAEKMGARIVRTEHSTRVYDDPTCWPFARWALPRAHAVVCISEHIRRRVVEKAPFLRRERVSVVYNGVDTDVFTPASEPRTTTSEDVVRFIALGRLDPRKGLDLALEALSRVRGATLDIVGEGEARAELGALVDRLGLGSRVRFRGYMQDARIALREADVVLSSAREEGLGIALLEGMAMGLPVVAVPVGGIVEIVDPGAGWLARERSASALIDVMCAAIDDRSGRTARGLRARARVIERFSVTAMRRGYRGIYEQIASR